MPSYPAIALNSLGFFYSSDVKIKQKDRLLDELRSELEDLRGPLPLGYAAADNSDAMSVASEVRSSFSQSVNK